MSADQGRSHVFERRAHRIEERSHIALASARRQEHDRQEPTRPDAHDGDIIGIDQDCVSTHIASGQGDGISGGDQRPFGNIDRAGVLTELGSKAHFAR